MANKVFKGIRMPGLNDFYVLPEAVAIEDENGFVEIQSYISDTVEVENIDTTLTKEGFAADAKAVGEALKNKAPKSYIIHGTIDGDDNVTLTDFNWEGLVAAATSDENIYVAMRLTYPEDGRVYEFALWEIDGNNEMAWFTGDGVEICYDAGDVYYEETHKREQWTFTLEDGSTVTKAVYVG